MATESIVRERGEGRGEGGEIMKENEKRKKN